MELQYKSMLHYLLKKLCNNKYGYTCRKSNRVKDRSYYFIKEYYVPIRFSNHFLHPNQERDRVIDVVITDTQNSTINKKPIFFSEEFKIRDFKKICLEYILLENHLYKISMRKHVV